MVNKAYDNAAPLRVLWAGREWVIDALEAAEFPALQVDDEFKTRSAFLGELLAAEEGER